MLSVRNNNLLLFMTRGMSLAAWRDNGSLERELALYAKLAEHGVSTAIISWGGKEDKAIAAPFPWLRVYANTHNLPPERYERLLPLLHALPLLRADLIKSNQVNGADLALRCARFWNKPFIARCGYLWSDFCRRENPALLEQAVAAEAIVFSGADAVVSTTEATCRQITAAYALPEGKARCIPNYVPEYFFALPPTERKTRETPIITAVGRLAPQKNLFALIDACAGLDVTLRLIGEGEQRAELTAHAVARGVNLELPGNLSSRELPPLLAESSVCALVSLFEGHPKALLEYMACACAVLGSKAEGIAPLIRDGENGLLCGTDATSIRQGLQSLLQDAPLRRRLGQQAREDARRFSLERIVEQELNLYGKLPHSSLVSSLGQGMRRSLVAAVKAAGRRKILLFRSALRRLKRVFDGRTKTDILPANLPQVTAMSGEDFIIKSITDIQSYIAPKTPAEALKVLFSIDEKLYAISSATSVAYDGGVHTKHRHTCYHDFFVNRLSAGEIVLDIGCGNGFLAYDMATKGKARVTGIDISPQNIATAKERFAHPNVTYTVGDALLDMPSGHFETIVLSNVLKHLPERVVFLQSVIQNLGPNRLLVRVPLFERDWRVPLKKELGLEWRLDPTHETEYTLESFNAEFADAGLMPVHLEIRWSEIWCEAKPAKKSIVRHENDFR
jgi:glycosyltransferase involved in cell wall biosynthesis/SAM-dependent methyltransferase